MMLSMWPSRPSGFWLLGVGRRVAFWKESRPQQVHPLLLGHDVQALVEHLVGEERRSQVHLVSSELTSDDLTASSPGRRRNPVSSGAVPSGPGLRADVTCRGRRSWARKAGPTCAEHRTESVLGEGKCFGSGMALKMTKKKSPLQPRPFLLFSFPTEVL